MEKTYKLLTKAELTQMRGIFEQVGNDPKYSAVKKLYAYIEAHGAVREDVYNYLLKHMEFMDASIIVLNSLVKTNAAPEWFELIKRTEDRVNESELSKDNMRLFQQVVIEAYRDNVPYSYVAEALDAARYPYEISQRIEQYHKNKNQDIESVIDGLRSVMEEVAKDRQAYQECYGQLTECIAQKDEIIKKLGEKINEIESSKHMPEDGEYDSAEKGAEKEKIDNEYEPQESELPDIPDHEMAKDNREQVREKTESREERNAELTELLEEIRRENELRREENNELLAGIKEMLQNLSAQPAERTENIVRSVAETIEVQKPDLDARLEQDGQPTVTEATTENKTESETPEKPVKEAETTKKNTLSEENIVVTKKDEEKEWKRVGLFQKIRENKRRIAFEKMADKKKLEELFLMMNEKKYNEEMIAHVRQCLTLGVSFEFLYAFIDMGAGEEEFKKLILFRDTSKKEKEVTETKPQQARTYETTNPGSEENTVDEGGADRL